MFTSPGAVAINTPHITIYWYGIIMAAAFLIGQFFVVIFAKKEYKEENIFNTLTDIAFWALLGGILGARLYYVLLSSSYYIKHPLEIIMLQNGGLSIQGALLGGIIAVLIYTKKTQTDFFKYADLYALGLPIAQAIGRWGNFFNSEAFGLPTSLPWGVFIPEALRPNAYNMYEFFHPTFLYESLWNIFIFLILFFVIKKHFFKNKGVVFFSYLILYSLGRILIETIRVDSVLNILGIPVAVWACFITIIISVVFLKKITKVKSL